MASKRLEVIIAGDPKGALSAFSAVDAGSGSLADKMAGLGKIAAIGMTGVAAAVVGVGVGLFKVGENFDDAFDKIRVGTGATGEALDGLEGSFKTVVSDVPADFGDASAAITALNSTLGLTGKPLEAMSEQLLNLSRITDTDVNENVKESAALFGNWGVAIGDQGGALDFLFRTTQQTGIGFGDLSSEVTENGVKMRELGFSLEDTAALFGGLHKAGIEASDIMPAFSKALATAAQDGRSAKDVLAETFATIKNAPADSLIPTQVAMDVFGAKAGPQLAGAIREGKLSFDDLKASIAGGKDTINTAATDTEDFGEKWTKFANKLSVLVEPIATRVFGAISTGIDNLQPAFDWLQGPGAEAFTSLATTISTALAPWVEALSGHFQTLMGWLQPLFDLISQNSEVFANIGRVLAVVAAVIVGVLVLAIVLVIAQIIVVAAVIGALIVILYKVIQVFWDVAQNIASAIADAARAVWGFMQGVWSAMQSVGEAIGRAWQAFLDFAGRVGEAVSGAVQTVKDRFGDVIGFIAGLPGRIASAASGLFDGIKDAFRGAVNWIIDHWNNLSFSLPSVDLFGQHLGGGSLDTPDLPRFAAGGVSLGGLALVGERGPELVNLPRGAMVTSSGATASLLDRGDDRVEYHLHLNVETGAMVHDDAALARYISGVLKELQRSGGSVPWPGNN